MWFRVDDGFIEHPKVLHAAERLGGGRRSLGRVVAVWVEGGTYASRKLTDGFVPWLKVETFLTDDKPRQVVDAMIAAGLITATNSGIQYHDWSDYQPSASAVVQQRAKARTRKERYLERRLERVPGDTGTPHGTPLGTPYPVPVPVPQDQNSLLSPDPSVRADGIAPTPALVFPVTGGLDLWALSDLALVEMVRAYPHLDVPAELEKAAAWLSANPKRQKTGGGMPRFLVNWLNRADRDRASRSPQARNGTPVSAGMGWFDECKTLHGGACEGQYQHHIRVEKDALGDPHVLATAR